MIKRTFLISLVLVLIFLGSFIPFFIYLSTPSLPRNPSITVQKGMTLRAISLKLEENGIIRHSWAFLTYARLMGAAKKLQAGEYHFEEAISPRNVLKRLATGAVTLYKIQLIEGWTTKQFADYLKTLEFIEDPNFSEAFLDLAKDLEGYLLPDTYYFPPEATTKDFLLTLTNEFEKSYGEILQNVATPPTLSKHEIVTLASLIEKETGVDTERSLVASVFYNRLAKGMRLQSDPTIIYGLKNFDGNIRKKDIHNPHRYNTYVHKGLPPGPICNPGKASIIAALQPAQTDYYYFVSKQDGSHYFSKTGREHINAVRKYQLGK